MKVAMLTTCLTTSIYNHTSCLIKRLVTSNQENEVALPFTTLMLDRPFS